MSDTLTCADIARATNADVKLAYGVIVASLIELIDLEMAVRDGEPIVTKSLTPAQQHTLAQHMSRYGRVWPDAPISDAVRSGVASMRDAILPRRKPTVAH